MRVLFLTSYFPPEHAASPYLANNRYEALAKSGFEMVVYTPMPTRGVSPDVRNQYYKKKHELLYDNHMIVHRFHMMRESHNMLLRAFRYMCTAIIQFNKAIFAKDARKCNLLFISSTPPIQGAMGALVKKIRGIPMIYNLQDIFPDSLVASNKTTKGSIVWKIGRFIEDFTYKNADKIIVISQDFKRNLIAKGVDDNKIEVIYNWVEEESVIDIPREKNILFDKYKLNRDEFYVTYCGNIGLSQNIDMLLELAFELRNYSDIHFVLIGDGVYKHIVETKIKENNISNVTLLPFQPYKDISHVFSLGDVGLVISKPGIGGSSVPSKTWSILSASRPVLANFDENELKEIIVRNECGLFTKAGDKQALKEAILELYSSRDLCKLYGDNGRKFILNNLTKEIGMGKTVKVIRKLLNN